MISLEIIDDALLKQWNQNTNVFLFLIDRKMNILDYNSNFEEYAKSIHNFEDILTTTHKEEFLEQLGKCLDKDTTKSFKTNFTFDTEHKKNIPESYLINVQKHEDQQAIVIAEHQCSLSHNDAISYFSMLNDFSVMTLNFYKTEHKLKKTNARLKEEIDKAKYYANYDELTRVFNRRRIVEELDNELKKFKRLKHNFTIVMLDLDNLKLINETYGQHNGDKVLEYVSFCLKNECREYDKIGRFNGGGFMMILPDTVIDNTANLLQRVLKYLKTHPIKIDGGYELVVTFSAGVVQPAEKYSIDSVITEAEVLVNKAKKSGKDQVVF